MENDGVVYPMPPPPNAASRKYDTDSPVDMTWIFERAVERAAKFGIKGVDYMMTLVREIVFHVAFMSLNVLYIIV